MTEPQITGRILIIDDNSSIHDDFRKVLKSNRMDTSADDAAAAFFGVKDTATPSPVSYEFELAHAMQGEEGLELLARSHDERRPFDLAFVDMRMPPGWDGLKTIEQLWKRDPELQIVICSAYSDHSWQDLVKKLGIRDSLVILKKPFDHSEVIQLACALTRKRNLARLTSSVYAELEEIADERTAGLRAAHEESERLLASISYAMIGIDEFGNVQRWNETATHVFGMDRIDAVNRPFARIGIGWEDPNRISGFISNQYAVAGESLDSVFRDREGNTQSTRLVLFPVFRDGVRKGVILLFTGIPDQTRQDVDYGQDQSLDAAGQLAASVAHEIGSPLQSISENLEFLRQWFAWLEPLMQGIEKMMSGEGANLPEILNELTASIRPQNLQLLRNRIPGALQNSIEGVEQVSRIVSAMQEFSGSGVEAQIPVDTRKGVQSNLTVFINR